MNIIATACAAFTFSSLAASDGRLLGLSGNELIEIDPETGAFTPLFEYPLSDTGRTLAVDSLTGRVFVGYQEFVGDPEDWVTIPYMTTLESDGSTNTVTLQFWAQDLVYDSFASRLLALGGNGNLWEIDPYTGMAKSLYEYPLFGWAGQLTVDPDTGRIYATYTTESDISHFYLTTLESDGTATTVELQFPVSDLVYDPSRSRLLAAIWYNGIVELDPNTGAHDNIFMYASCCERLAINPHSGLIFVAFEDPIVLDRMLITYEDCGSESTVFIPSVPTNLVWQAGEADEEVVGDLNQDGVVNTADLLILFSNWGPSK